MPENELKYIPVDEARKLAKKYNAERLIIIYSQDIEYGYTSYGKNRDYCQSTKKAADFLLDKFAAILAGIIKVK